MNTLQRTLIEKAGHDFGFEYIVSDEPSAVILGSARHPLHLDIALGADDSYQVTLVNPKAVLVAELQRDFAIAGNACVCGSIADLAQLFQRAAALAHSLPNQAEQDFDSAVAKELHKLPAGAKGTEVERIVRQRVGQDTYRKAMLEYWGGACAVTGVALPAVLRASHALPWAECNTDAQRLDVFNGLLLTANLDALFDRFLISFSAEGHIQLSPGLTEDNLAALGVTPDMQLRWVTAQHEVYLGQHRAKLEDIDA